MLGTATWGALAIGLLSRDGRWLAMSAGVGAVWWFSDLIVYRVLRPAGSLLMQRFQGNGEPAAQPGADVHDATEEPKRKHWLH